MSFSWIFWRSELHQHPKTPSFTIQTSQNKTRWDVSDIHDSMYKPMFAEFGGRLGCLPLHTPLSHALRTIDVKNVQKSIKNVKKRKNVTKIKNVCKRWIKNVTNDIPALNTCTRHDSAQKKIKNTTSNHCSHH